MPTKPCNRPLKKISKHPKPVTPRQVAFLAQREKDRRHTRPLHSSQIGQELDHWLPNRNLGIGNPDIDMHEDADNPFDPHGLNEGGEEDVESLLPDSSSDWEDEDDIISGLARAQYDRKRLENEVRWAEVCARIVPTFLECRKSTSNWGHPEKWKDDFKRDCSCPESRRRVSLVDLVDLISKHVHDSSDPLVIFQLNLLIMSFVIHQHE